MATVSANRNAEAAKSALRNLNRYRSEGTVTRPDGVYMIKLTRDLTAAQVADFDGAGDFLEFGVMPANTYLLGAHVTVPDMDAHATPQITLDLMADATVLVNNDNAGQAGGDVEYADTGAGEDVGGKTMKLKIETGPQQAQTTYTTFTMRLRVYHGAPVTV